jgi:hypothetical protein
MNPEQSHHYIQLNEQSNSNDSEVDQNTIQTPNPSLLLYPTNTHPRVFKPNSTPQERASQASLHPHRKK